MGVFIMEHVVNIYRTVRMINLGGCYFKKKYFFLMYCFSSDPFNKEYEKLPKWRQYDIKIITTKTTQSSAEATQEFAQTLKAINQVHRESSAVIPPRAQFFDFGVISDYELQFPFAHHDFYIEIRNYMVAISRIFRNRYVPFTLYRRSIKAPAGFIYSVYMFLTEHGLINYQIDEKTRPKDIITETNLWPHLLYTPNDQIYAESTYNHKIHPKSSIPPLPIPLYPLVCAPFFSPDRKPTTAEIPGLMTLGSWTLEENNKLLECLLRMKQPNSNFTDDWASVSRYVQTKTPEECALQLAQYPVYDDSEKQAITSFREFSTPKEIIKNEVLSKNPEMRVAYTATHVLGHEKSKLVMQNKDIDEIESAEQANSLIALKKMKANAEHLKQLHKKRILEILSGIVEVTKASIEAKRRMISEQRKESTTSTTRSESETEE